MTDKSLLRSPLIHFLMLGALAFAARDPLVGLARPLVARPPSVSIDAERVDGLRRGWQSEMGRAPTRAELARLIEAELDDELLYREALARRLDEDDPGIALRLVQKMTFLDEGTEDVEPARLVERARALGLERDDVVIRRLLIQKLRLQATALAPNERPQEDELARAYAERIGALREPERRSVIHVFLGRDQRGPRLASDARALRERLEREAIPPVQATRLGDAFPLGLRLERRSRDELARTLGDRFAAESFALTPGRWSLPIESAYGIHLVHLERVEAGSLPPFESARIALRRALEEEARARKLAALLAELRTRYEVAVAEEDLE